MCLKKFAAFPIIKAVTLKTEIDNLSMYGLLKSLDQHSYGMANPPKWMNQMKPYRNAAVLADYTQQIMAMWADVSGKALQKLKHTI